MSSQLPRLRRRRGLVTLGASVATFLVLSTGLFALPPSGTSCNAVVTVAIACAVVGFVPTGELDSPRMKQALVKRAIPLTAMVFLATALGLASGGPRLERLALPGEGHLASAWIPETGPALVSWISTEAGWSRVIVYEDGQRTREWVFDDELVKDARWIEPGETLRLGVVDAQGSDTRVYAIGNEGALQLLGSTRGVTEAWGEVSLSADGTLWVAVSFDADAATLGVGPLGSDRPAAQWKVPAPSRISERALDDLNQAGFAYRDGGEPLIVLLWKGHLWLSEPTGVRSVEIEPPGDCDQVQHFTSAARGFWVQCSRGFDAKPGIIWGYYQSEIPSDGRRPAARALGVFTNPWFRWDGSVISRDRRQGTLELAVAVAGEENVRKVGTLNLPPPGDGARWVPAGDVLLETQANTEEYRVLHVGSEIARLRARNAS